ncbi:MAG: glutathione S-transferase family protein [Alphaproteobacteria bacterium]|nr:glutathione S-transferase family protein [Alphaproteobacteria bacterium]
MENLQLVATPVGPWEQGVATVLHAKSLAFELVDIDPYVPLAERPTWFRELSPSGKAPVLVHDGAALFETRAIAEYLDDRFTPRLHPVDLVERARHRACLDALPGFQRASSDVNNAKSENDVIAALDALPGFLEPLGEAHAVTNGPLFGGPVFSMVDALYAPFLHRLAWAAPHLGGRLGRDPFDGFPAVREWAQVLLAQDAVCAAIRPDFEDRYREHLVRRGNWLAGTL